MSVKVSAEKNFRRAKVKPVKKRSASARLSWRAATTLAVGLLSLYAVYRATSLVLSASALQVRQITIQGNAQLSRGEVQALLRGLHGANILTADLDGYRHRLRESPWVSEVAIRRVLPSTVEVVIAERRPIGLIRIRSDLYLVDRAGVTIAEYGPQLAEFDLPLIDGAVGPPRDGQPLVNAAATEFAARFLDAVATDQQLASRISQVDVRDLRNVVVLLDDETTFLHLGADNFVERLRSYDQLKATLRASVPEIDYVDLRFDPRIYVQPVRGRRAVDARPLPAGN